jgi:hypothetical protein
MNCLHKQAYVVTPFHEELGKLEAAGLIPIHTDGTYFITQIKQQAVSKGFMLSDNIFDAAEELLSRVFAEHTLLHKTVKLSEHPEAMFAASYQDGMIHALERALHMRGTGQYSNYCRITNVIQSYLKWQKEKLRNGVYEDVAYIQGYINALTHLLIESQGKEDIPVPLYFYFGVKDDVYDLADYLRQLNLSPVAHKAAHKRARRYLKCLSRESSLECHHPPWL